MGDLLQPAAPPERNLRQERLLVGCGLLGVAPAAGELREHRRIGQARADDVNAHVVGADQWRGNVPHLPSAQLIPINQELPASTGESIAAIKAGGADVVFLSDEEAERWRTVALPLWETFAADNGENARTMLDEAVALRSAD